MNMSGRKVAARKTQARNPWISKFGHTVARKSNATRDSIMNDCQQRAWNRVWRYDVIVRVVDKGEIHSHTKSQLHSVRVCQDHKVMACVGLHLICTPTVSE